MLESVKDENDWESVTKSMQQYGGETSTVFKKNDQAEIDENQEPEDANNDNGSKSVPGHEAAEPDSGNPKKEDQAELTEKPAKSDPFEDFGRLLARWNWSLDDKPMTLLVLAEAWNRFTNSIKTLDELFNREEPVKKKGNEDKWPRIGIYFQYCIIVLLNHLFEFEQFIRDSQESTTSFESNKVSQDSYFDSDTARLVSKFNENLAIYAREPDRYWIFGFLFSCPVWLHFWDWSNTDPGTEYKRADLDNIRTKYADALQRQTQLKKGNKEEVIELIKISRCITRNKSNAIEENSLFDVLNALTSTKFSNQDKAYRAAVGNAERR
jgi:hypothetical protein